MRTDILMQETHPVAPLRDTHGRMHDYLRISLTDRCNMHCLYCMPAEQQSVSPASTLMTADEIFSIASTFVQHGIKKIRLTGGEPLLRTDARQIIRQLGTLPVQLAITTNGTVIHEFIADFIVAGIHTVNVSLDTFDSGKFFRITRRRCLDQVLSNIHLLLRANLHVRINAVIVRGVNDDEITRFVQFTEHYPVHIRFIEFMPFAGNGWSRDKVVPFAHALGHIMTNFPVYKLPDEKNSTAKKYKVPGHAGTFAFINTITFPFCHDCSRLRLSADGKMRNCLFSAAETDLLSALRRGDDISPLILQSVLAKEKQTGGHDFSIPFEKGRMSSIGG